MLLRKMLSALALFVLQTVIPQSSQGAPKPNFVIIVADDLGWDDVGFHGSPEVKTPNIDKLATEGVILNDYYVQPICTPTRSALLTGKYPIRNGMQSSVIMTSQPWGLGLDEKLLPQYLKELNYKTHLVGKWHLGFFSKNYLPLKRGFDTFFGCYSGRGDYWDHSSEAGELDGLDLRNGDEPIMNEWGNYSTTMFTDIAVDRIKSHKGPDPMFLMLSHLAVHSANSKAPLQAPDEDQKLFADVQDASRKMYLAMVSSLDKSVGRVFDALKESNMLKNTVLIFTTDNGGASKGFDMNFGSNYPFRGMKTILFEGGVRAAGFVYSPLIKEKNRVSGDLLHVTDWFPTILSLAGGKPEPKIDGINVWDTLSSGAKSPRNDVLLNIDDLVYKNSAYRKGKWKIVFQDSNELSEWYNPPDYERQAYRNRREKLDFHKSIIDCENMPETTPNCSHGCLFDIEADPCEYEDLSKSNSDVFDQLKEKLDSFRKEMVEPRYKHDADMNSNPRNHGGIWSPWIEEESGNPVPHKPLPAGSELPGRPAATSQQPAKLPAQQRFTANDMKHDEDKVSGSTRSEEFESWDNIADSTVENIHKPTKKTKNSQTHLKKNSNAHIKERFTQIDSHARQDNLLKIIDDIEKDSLKHESKQVEY